MKLLIYVEEDVLGSERDVGGSFLFPRLRDGAVRWEKGSPRKQTGTAEDSTINFNHSSRPLRSHAGLPTLTLQINTIKTTYIGSLTPLMSSYSLYNDSRISINQ